MDQFDEYVERLKRAKLMAAPEPEREERNRDDIVEPLQIKISSAQEEHNPLMEAFLSRGVALPSEEIKSKYYDSPYSITTKDTWTDLEPGRLKQLNMFNMSHIKLIELGADTLASLKNQITTRSIFSLFILAFNLTDSEGNRLFNAIEPRLILEGESVELEEIDNRTIKTVIDLSTLIFSPSYKTDASFCAVLKNAFCFLACSYIRLFTKNPKSFVKSQKHIRARFEHFYSADFPLENSELTEDAATSIQSIFHTSELAKNTLYPLLYAGEASQHGANIKAYLYKIHLSFTGLHPFTLFVRAMELLKMGSRTLAACLHSDKLSEELLTITNVMKDLVDSKNTEIEYKMWRYARIFDPTFLAVLQTKHCQFFTLVLATLLYTLAPEQHKNVFDIAQLGKCGKTQKTLAKAYALRAYQAISRASYTENFAGLENIIR